MRSLIAINDNVSNYTSKLDYLRGDPSELGLEGQLSWEELGAQWEHNLHELSPQVKKCDGAEVVTKRLKDMGVPQVMKGHVRVCAVRIWINVPTGQMCSEVSQIGIWVGGRLIHGSRLCGSARCVAQSLSLAALSQSFGLDCVIRKHLQRTSEFYEQAM